MRGTVLDGTCITACLPVRLPLAQEDHVGEPHPDVS